MVYGVSVPGIVRAQLPTPQLQSIFPTGAQRGSSAECTITGAELTGATGLYFSHPGLKGELIKPNVFKVSVAADVPVGRYDVRAICPLGVSSPRMFVVGDRREFVEKEPNNARPEAQRIELPAVVNGQSNGGLDLDHYVFSAKRGQRIFFDCWAWRIDSQIDATLMVFDAAGHELAYGGDYYGKDPLVDFTVPADGDYTVKIWDFVYGGGATNVYRLEIGSLPHLDAVLPAAVQPGHSSPVTLFGRNLPGGKPVAGITVEGLPLEMLSRDIRAADDPLSLTSLRGGEAIRPPQTSVDGMDYRLETPEGTSNPIFIGFTTDPIVLEQEPNDKLETAQPLTAPCEVSGSFTPAGDKDFYRFTAKRGERLIVEVFGERHSGLVDPILLGYDKQGKRIQAQDDYGRNIGQLRFTTTSRDARWDFNVPADGDYYVQVRDLYFQQRGEARFTYRLALHAPRPDFRLLAVPVAEVLPDATVVRRGSNHWLDVLAFRNDDYAEPIVVRATNLPPGVTCEPVTIGPGKTSVPLVLHAAADAPLGHAAITITGEGLVDGKPTKRVGRAGGLIWATVNTPGVARLCDTVVVSVREPPPFSISAKLTKTVAAAGAKIPIDVTLARASDWNESVQLSGFDLPSDKATMPLVNVAKGATTGKVELTIPANIKPGAYTFTVQGSGQVPRNYATETDPKKRGNNIRCVATSNPLTITIEGEPKK